MSERVRPAPPPPDLAARLAWRNVTVAAALIAVAQLAFVAIDLWVHGVTTLLPLRMGHAALATALLTYLLVRRGQPATTAATVAFAAIATPLLLIFWVSEVEMARSGLLWAPLVGMKLSFLGIALLTPGPLWLGAGLIGALAAESVALWVTLDFASHPGAAAAGEPWVTVVFGLVAAVLLVWRDRHRHLIQEYTRARTEAVALERLAQQYLAMRDLANTPLQTLKLGLTLLERDSPDSAPLLARMRRAVEGLGQLTALLTRYEEHLRWSGGDADSDALLHQAPRTAGPTGATP
jgi:hypothetical protein